MRLIMLICAILAAAGCGRHAVSTLAGAARNGDVQAIGALLQAGADPEEPSGVNHWTPLLHAIHQNRRGSVVALLDGGAKVNARCCGGQTALTMAAGYGQADIVAVLLARGADTSIRNNNGMTALDAALTGVADIDDFTIGKCQTETVKLLLGTGRPALAARAAGMLKSCPEIDRLLAAR